ncbi:MAG: hypothetical protein IKA80_09245, partial [Spirochaetaceae bacterium]|nr:hypothetical protein [Spirochaetaceae bacterium]
GHAILSCKGVVNEPFAVINSDDFYGRDAYMKAANFLKEDTNTKFNRQVNSLIKCEKITNNLCVLLFFAFSNRIIVILFNPKRRLSC